MASLTPEAGVPPDPTAATTAGAGDAVSSLTALPLLSPDPDLGQLTNGRSLQSLAPKGSIGHRCIYRSAAPTPDDHMVVRMKTVVDLRSAEEGNGTESGAHPMCDVDGCRIIQKPHILNGKGFAKAILKAQPCCCVKCKLCCACLTCRMSKKRLASVIVAAIAEPENVITM
eukprot:COSAG01_NODE_29424_length_638_cov_0.673469_1_plen_171_part_10